VSLVGVPAPWRAFVAEINGIGRIPDGTPGIRDVDAPCDTFQPGDPGHGNCQTDGHYICVECIKIDPRTLRTRRDECEECGTPRPRVGAVSLGDCPNGCDDPSMVRRGLP